MYRILIAEDDVDIAELMRLYLMGEDYEVVIANDGLKAWEIFQNNEFHMMIVDIMMPGMDGYELIRNIRTISNIPAIIVSAKDKNIDKIIGFNAGADMYLTKPFDPAELLANVRAAIRRYYQLGGAETVNTNHTVYHYKDLVLDTQSMTLKQGSNTIPLTATEIRIMAMMFQSPGKIFTREQIAEGIRSDFIESDAKTIAVHISNIRKKLQDDSVDAKYIKSVRGLGYKLGKE